MNYSKITKLTIFTIFVFALIFSISSCKKFGIPDYKITVVFENTGIQGTPAEGENIYEDLTAVEYDYSAVDPSYAVEVWVNGDPWNPSGTITMYTDISVVVRFFDIRGVWEFRKQDLEQVIVDTFKITVTGDDMVSGTFSDDQGRTGVWGRNVDDGAFLFSYDNWDTFQFQGQNAVTSSYTIALAGNWLSDTGMGYFDALRIE